MELEQILSCLSPEDTTNRLFGVEIEVIGINPHTAASVLSRAGIPIREEGYNHSRRTWWKATTDGSLTNRSDGFGSCELVSPPLPFNIESLKLVAGVIRILDGFGATVDQSCGIHVHVDSRDLAGCMVDFSRVIFLRYRECEEVIDQMVAPHRRVRSNTYCKTLKDINRNTQYGSLRYDRYQKLNFHSFERHGTLEFRQLEGCLEETKVVSWIIFCLTFFEQTRTYFLSHGISEISEANRWV